MRKRAAVPLPNLDDIAAERARRARSAEADLARKQSLRSYLGNPAGFVRDCVFWPPGETPAPHQLAVLESFPQHGREAARGPHGLGKAQPVDLVIDTPDGPRRFGDLVPGDRVFGGTGAPTEVLGVYEQGERQVYRVIFDDGASTVCCAAHLWTVQTPGTTNRWQTATSALADLVRVGLRRPNGRGKARRWAIPVTGWDYPPVWVPVHPYVLGAWLGDGTRLTGIITNTDEAVQKHIEAVGYRVTAHPERINFTVHGLASCLASLGLRACRARDKFIPAPYLYTARPFREELLRGLLDTDGWISRDGAIQFGSRSDALVRGVVWLCRSLGGVARMTARMVRASLFWRATLTLPDGVWFYVPRKQIRVRATTQKRYLTRWMDQVIPAGVTQTRCLRVAAADGLYLANDGIVTHNTTIAAWLVLWFALTRDLEDTGDWKIPTTASAWRQLTNFLWPEIHKWARRLHWTRLGRPPFDSRTELQTLSLKLQRGEAFAIASDRPELIEGAHAKSLLYIFDEAKTIPAATWDAAEGAFASAGADTGSEAYAFAISTPGVPSGRFYDIHVRRVGLEDWHARHITKDEAIAAGRMSAAWAEQRQRQWGEASEVYQNRVLGEFASQDEASIIPLAWLELANERWRDAEASGVAPVPMTALGVDVGLTGDRTVFAPRHGPWFARLQRFPHQAIMATAGHVVAAVAWAQTAVAVIDVIGIGAGVYDRCREQGVRVTPFNAATRTDIRDRSGELGFVNLRAAAWWGLRERLDPTAGEGLAIPPDDELMGDLLAPRWRMTSTGKLQVEDKDAIRVRLGRSPDAGDALVMAAAAELIRGTPVTLGGTIQPTADALRGSAYQSRPVSARNGRSGRLVGRPTVWQ